MLALVQEKMTMEFNPEGYEIIDAHIHPVPPISGTDLTLFGNSTDGGSMVRELRLAGIRQGCGSVLKTLDYETMTFADIHELNEAGLALREQFPDFYIPGITVHPKFPEESCRELEEMVRRRGVRFVGELVAHKMGYRSYSQPSMNPIWECIRDLNLPVNVHIGELEDIAEVLRRFPTLKLIIAHPTANPDFYRQRLELIAQYPNAAIDISGSGPNSWGMIRFGIKTAGLEKILFGTDFPLRHPGMYVAGVYAERLSPDEMTAVFAGNLKRLMRY